MSRSPNFTFIVDQMGRLHIRTSENLLRLLPSETAFLTEMSVVGIPKPREEACPFNMRGPASFLRPIMIEQIKAALGPLDELEVTEEVAEQGLHLLRNLGLEISFAEFTMRGLLPCLCGNFGCSHGPTMKELGFTKKQEEAFFHLALAMPEETPEESEETPEEPEELSERQQAALDSYHRQTGATVPAEISQS
ncbi:hypothetical protein HN748_03160 [Candidatus Peregrinibacteria bacterium]|nr:hypothetical protein [Candidatus Peregrinibacteria bacterium]MBT7703207.1 hypothetical protein [Candidatus Peregrinibacteria bacterium]